MTILDATLQLQADIKTIYDEREATNIAKLIMENITGFSNAQQRLKKMEMLNVKQQAQLKIFTKQLRQHKPVQYVLHEAWFAGLKFYVDENVLIPRPETEELAQLIVEESKSGNKNPVILDIGTGSGCIAIALKKKLLQSLVYAMDINYKALNIAKGNAAVNEVSVHFFKADILDFELNKSLPAFDIIVSNPPYIKQSEAALMHQNVLKYEPHIALFVPDDDALLFYKAITDFSLLHLKNGGKLYVEINETQGKVVTDLFKHKGFTNVKIKKDLQQKDRFVTASMHQY